MGEQSSDIHTYVAFYLLVLLLLLLVLLLGMLFMVIDR